MKKQLIIALISSLSITSFADEQEESAKKITLKTLEAPKTSQVKNVSHPIPKDTNPKKIKIQDGGSIVVNSNVSCEDNSPCAIVANTTREVLKNLKNDSPYELIQDVIVPKFDFRLMTKYALGKNWRLAKPSQQTQLVELFKELLIYTYSSALSKFQDAEITITNSDINNSSNNKLAIVVSQVYLPNNDKANNNQPVKVEYDLAYLNNQWKAYDIKIENASLVTTYRNQFNDIIQSNGVEGLINQLKTKNAGLKKKA
ncbi:MAG TPA: ABC transporter substrate-binding protein [Burkholderiales bacterium]|nr:ABC transporter substrate-binding protein [Burkholderiales bacterium]